MGIGTYSSAKFELNKCSNIVNILGEDYLAISATKEKVGVIYLEYINGVELGRASIENFTSKEKFSIIKQLYQTASAVASPRYVIPLLFQNFFRFLKIKVAVFWFMLYC